MLSPTGSITVSWVDEAEAARLRVLHAPFGRCEVMTWDTFEQRAAGVPLPSMAGTFERHQDDALVFTPTFLFEEGARYALVVDGALVATFVRPVTPPPAPTTVSAIFPTGGTVPANLRRMYIHFSAPMSEEFAAHAVRISDAVSGASLPDVLQGGGQERWNPARTRLTLLLDPGRLIQGRPVVITVGAILQDAAGQPLGEECSRRYGVGPALAGPLDPALWTMNKPAAGSLQALQLAFDRPLDRALLARCLAVQHTDGTAVDGEIHVAAGERSWTFRPRQPWIGPCALVVDAHLEDVAGNAVAENRGAQLLPIELRTSG